MRSPRKKQSRATRDKASYAEQEQQIASQIRKLESLIEEAPAELQRRMEEERTTMPPPDDLDDRRREHKFYAQLSRRQIRNEHRHQARSGMLFFLLATAIGALSFWMYNFLQGLQ